MRNERERESEQGSHLLTSYSYTGNTPIASSLLISLEVVRKYHLSATNSTTTIATGMKTYTLAAPATIMMARKRSMIWWQWRGGSSESYHKEEETVQKAGK